MSALRYDHPRLRLQLAAHFFFFFPWSSFLAGCYRLPFLVGVVIVFLTGLMALPLDGFCSVNRLLGLRRLAGGDFLGFLLGVDRSLLDSSSSDFLLLFLLLLDTVAATSVISAIGLGFFVLLTVFFLLLLIIFLLFLFLLLIVFILLLLFLLFLLLLLLLLLLLPPPKAGAVAEKVLSSVRTVTGFQKNTCSTFLPKIGDMFWNSAKQ